MTKMVTPPGSPVYADVQGERQEVGRVVFQGGDHPEGPWAIVAPGLDVDGTCFDNLARARYEIRESARQAAATP